MGSLIEEFNAMKIQVAKALAKNDQAALHRQIHIVDHEAERERKRTNPKKSTKVMLNCRTPDQWKEFQMAKEKYFETAVDPHLAIDCMVRALNSHSAEEIARWVKEGFEPGIGPPKANVPKWMEP
jgi:hypothetical protein